MADPLQLYQDPPLKLSPRESEVLQLIAYGYNNRAIAKELGVQESSSGGYIVNVGKKILLEDYEGKVNTRVALAQFYWRIHGFPGEGETITLQLPKREARSLLIHLQRHLGL